MYCSLFIHLFMNKHLGHFGSHVQLCAAPWTIACQAPPSMGFSREEYWSELPFPSPRDLAHPRIKSSSPAMQADSLPSEPWGKVENHKLICSKHFFLFFKFIFIGWRLVTLQYCSGFCHTLTWISHGVTCIPYPDPPSHLPLYPIPLGLPSVPGPSTCLMHPTWAGDLFHHR